jgi:hypothetical protein
VANYGEKQFYSGRQFVPGYSNALAPFGTWTAPEFWLTSSYYSGTDNGAQWGVICLDNVAVILVNDRTADTGHLDRLVGFWYGGGFTSNGLTQITQLGCPVGLNNGVYLECNDSQGYINSNDPNDIIIGSDMNGGSSGGPWVANFGLPSALTGEMDGSFSPANVIVAVTSWGYLSTGQRNKELPSSPATISLHSSVRRVARHPLRANS